MDDAEYVDVTWGPELFSPIKYHTITVGPLHMRTRIQEGESPQQAVGRAWNALNKAAATIYKAQKAAFLDLCAEVATDARNRGSRGE